MEEQRHVHQRDQTMPSSTLQSSFDDARIFLQQSIVGKRIKLNSKPRTIFEHDYDHYDRSKPSISSTKHHPHGAMSRMSSHGLTPELLSLLCESGRGADKNLAHSEEGDCCSSMEWQVLPCLKEEIPGDLKRSLLRNESLAFHSYGGDKVRPFPRMSAAGSRSSIMVEPVIFSALGKRSSSAISGVDNETKEANAGEKATLDRNSNLKSKSISWKSKRGRFSAKASVASSDYSWMPFLKLLKEHRDYPEFVYLRPSKAKQSAFDPYDLEIVTYDEIQNSYYYTMSSAGVTYFSGSDAEFIPLDEWESDFEYYKCIMNLPVFRQYKLWKSLLIWKHFVRRKLQRISSKSLRKKLFVTNPILQRVLLQIRNVFFLLSKMTIRNEKG